MMASVEVDRMDVFGEVVEEVGEMVEDAISTAIAVRSGTDTSIKRQRTKEVQLRLRIRFLLKWRRAGGSDFLEGCYSTRTTSCRD